MRRYNPGASSAAGAVTEQAEVSTQRYQPSHNDINHHTNIRQPTKARCQRKLARDDGRAQTCMTHASEVTLPRSVRLIFIDPTPFLGIHKHSLQTIVDHAPFVGNTIARCTLTSVTAQLLSTDNRRTHSNRHSSTPPTRPIAVRVQFREGRDRPGPGRYLRRCQVCLCHGEIFRPDCLKELPGPAALGAR